VTAAEGVARSRLRSRSGAWLLVYPLLGAAALASRPPAVRPARISTLELVVGLGLAAAGYSAGRAILGSRPHEPPPESLELELAAVAGVVAPAEELIWGRCVETRVGIPLCAALFAAKHVAIDGRWRRSLGLSLFWVGLGLVRRRSPALALAVHVAANAAAVIAGHATGRDSF
jgi:hypothetical protein